MLEFFIAKRYLKSKRKFNFITILTLLSGIGITIGVSALVVVLSVFNGFGSLVTSILVNLDPHVRVTAIDEKGQKELAGIESFLRNDKNIASYNPYVEGKIIALKKNSYQILSLKGITSAGTKQGWGIETAITSGKFDISGSNVIIGLPMALRLSARVGDTLLVTSAYNIDKAILSMAIPTTKKFIISGIFESNNRDYDISYIFGNITTAQSLFSKKKQIDGFEIRLTDLEKSESLKEELLTKTNPNSVAIYTWYDLHKDLFDVMLIERWSAYILLCLIIAVATFNILGSLTMTVIEKKKDIGVLRTMGIDAKSVLKIFLFEGLLIGIIGTLAGITIGLVICYLQIEYNFYPLDPAKFIINAMPVQIRISDLIVISMMSLFLSFTASFYPAKRAAATKIIDSIKWE